MSAPQDRDSAVQSTPDREKTDSILYATSPDKLYRNISQDSIGAYYMPKPPPTTPNMHGQLDTEDTG